MTNSMTRQLTDHHSPCVPFQPHLSWLWHLLQAFAPNPLYHNARHVNQSSETEHSSPEEIMFHQRMEELANPPFFSLLLFRA